MLNNAEIYGNYLRRQQLARLDVILQKIGAHFYWLIYTTQCFDKLDTQSGGIGAGFIQFGLLFFHQIHEQTHVGDDFLHGRMEVPE